MLSNLSGADGNIARVARALGMSPRTLQRRLREEGVSYASLVDDIRQRLSLTLLRDGRRSVTEISDAPVLGADDLPARLPSLDRALAARPPRAARAARPGRALGLLARGARGAPRTRDGLDVRMNPTSHTSAPARG
ncbi:helix-turn-helix domain-containing protein [Sorangium sp. So ce315]|uniref:helix-turn-helix domain-containing protein n=1 Tax=Sorangium sp. So ce315 TaxID=3133299 RepID=UPI003F629089